MQQTKKQPIDLLQVKWVLDQYDRDLREEAARDLGLDDIWHGDWAWDKYKTDTRDLARAIMRGEVREFIFQYTGPYSWCPEHFAYITPEIVLKSTEPDSPYTEDVVALVDFLYSSTAIGVYRWGQLRDNGVVWSELAEYLFDLYCDHDQEIDNDDYDTYDFLRDNEPRIDIIAKAYHGDKQAEKQVIAMMG